MPYLKKKARPRSRESEDIKRKERQKVYSSKKWKLMRLAYIDQHPLCEICQQKGIISPAVDVHHRISFTDFEGLQRLEMAYNPQNLMALCKECHTNIHLHEKKRR